LTDLNQSRIGKASRTAVLVVALIDGLSPFLGALIVLIPFFVSNLFPGIQYVYYTSIGVAMLSLLSLGLFLGFVSKGNMLLYGLRTVIAGIISILISFLLGE
jgi:predicted membrane protein (TIGR00267 family)